MNFRTTLILLIVLVAAVGYMLYTGSGGSSSPQQKKINPTALLDIKSADVSKVVLSPKDGKPIVLERSTLTSPTPVIEKAKSNWSITSPIAAYADDSKVTNLIESVVSATSTAETPLDSANTTEFGLSDPQFTIEFQAGTKNAKVIVGRLENAANELYVRVEGKDVAEVVGGELLPKLDTTAEKLRLGKLIIADATTANWVKIDRPNDPISLEKSGGQWEMATSRPTTLPVDQGAAGDLIAAISGATAVEFGTDSTDPKTYIGTPTAKVTISDKKPGTQPSQGVSIEFGLLDSVGKNYWVRVTGTDETPAQGELATVPKETMDSILKSSLDLRDHNLVQIASSSVQKIRVVRKIPATTQPIAHGEIVRSTELTRRPKPKVVEGPPAPAPQPATLPTTMATTNPSTEPTTMAATQPAPPPPSTWQITSTRVPSDADDAKVDAALASFNPLKADKFLWGRPTTQPSQPAQTTYLVTLTDDKGVDTTVMFTDPGETSTDSPWGELINGGDDAIFNVPRAVITSIDSQFTKAQ